jgi:hypothetical protein
MNTLTFLIITLIVMYTFYIYKENIVIKSELTMLKSYIDRQASQTKELLNLYKDHNYTNDIFVETIGFDTKSALEHKEKRESMQNTEYEKKDIQDTTNTLYTEYEQSLIGSLQQDSTQTFDVPVLDKGIIAAPSEYDSLIL